LLIAALRAGSGATVADVPPTLLAIDTATDVCSVALARADRIIERVEAVGQKHSERILPMVNALLQETGLPLGECDAIAFGSGPGAFTGLRIACGIAQGLAFGAGKPVVAIGNLAALAWAANEAAPGARRILAAIDARMQEAYWALYSIEGGALTEMTAPALASADELLQMANRCEPDLVAGNALRSFPQLAAQLRCALAPHACASARSIATLAAVSFAEGGAMPAALAAPVYVRDRVALTIDERRAAAGAAAAAR